MVRKMSWIAVVLIAMLMVVLIVVPGAGSVGGAENGAPETVFLPEQITAENTPVRSAAVSSDGKWAVYASGPEGGADLWRISLDSAVSELPRRLTDDAFDELAPALSPDGRFLAYVGAAEDIKGDIFLLDLSRPESVPRRLTGRETEDGAPCFSADGKTLYYHLSDGPAARRLAMMRLDGGSGGAEPLITGGDAAFPAVSPRDGRVAFVSFRDDPSGDIWVYDSANRTAAAVTGGPSLDFAPVWSRDGGHLYFVRIGFDTNGDGAVDNRDHAVICRMDVSTPGPHPAIPLTSPRFSAFEPGLGGGRLFFLSDRGKGAQLWRLPADGEIPVLKHTAEQKVLADFLSGRIPPDPYRTLLARYRVFENASGEVQTEADALFEIGRIHLDLGDDLAAEQVLKMVADRYPGVHPHADLARIDLTAIQARREATESAGHEERRKIVVSASDRMTARLTAGSGGRVRSHGRIVASRLIMNHAGDADLLMKAVDFLDGAIADPGSGRDQIAEAMVLKADIYAALGWGENVLPAYVAVIQQFGRRPGEARQWVDLAVERVLDLATRETDAERTDDRVRILRKIYEDDRERAPVLAMGALNRVGDAYYRADEWAEAKSAYRQVLDVFPVATTQTAAARLALAEILFREERFREALDLYQAEIGIRGSEDRIFQLARDGYVRKSVAAGEYLLRLHEAPAAMSRFKSLLDYDDAIVEAHRGYIRCAAALREIPRVLAMYEARLAGKPDDPIALYGTALTLTYVETADALIRAQSLLIRAIQADGRIVYFHQTLGYVREVLETVHGREGSLPSALAAYQRAWFLNDAGTHPDNAAHLALNIGNIHFLMGQYGDALEYYMRRLDSDAPFPHPDTELLFYRRLGMAAFQAGGTDAAVSAYSKALELIESRIDPRAASAALDRINRFILDQIITPAMKEADLKTAAEKLAAAQSIQSRELAALTRAAARPPGPEWEAYFAGMTDLLKSQEGRFSPAMSLHGSLPNPEMDSETLGRTLTAMAENPREALAFPERLTELKAEMLDRIGLARQESQQWAPAVDAFEKAYALNERLGLDKNLALNRRSIAFNRYHLAGALFGDDRTEMLNRALADFQQAIVLVDAHGVRDKTPVKASGGAMIHLQVQVAMDQTNAGRSTRGFSADQEKRLAEAFIYRIQLELGNLAPAEKAVAAQLSAYPDPAAIPEGDRFGVSLLHHRAGHLALARRRPVEAFDHFERSAKMTLEMKNPLSTALNVANMAHVLWVATADNADIPDAESRLERADRRASILVDSALADTDSLAAAGFHNRMGVFYSTVTLPAGRTDDLETMVTDIRRRQRAWRHFNVGLRQAGSGGNLQTRRGMELTAVLHLNLAEMAAEWGDGETAREHFESARQLANAGALPDISWRALAGLGETEAALNMVETAPLTRAGCGPLEIAAAFGPMAADLARAGEAEAAFNLVERLSEIERFHRMAPFTGLSRRAVLYDRLYPVLSRIRDIKASMVAAEGEEKTFLTEQLARERAILDSGIGANTERLSELLRWAGSRDRLEQLLVLMGIAARAESAADEVVAAGGKSVDSEAYQALLARYRELFDEIRFSETDRQGPDLISFFGPTPAEAFAVMEALAPDGVMLRLFQVPGESEVLVFRLTPEEISVSIAADIRAVSMPEQGIAYVAYEHPEALSDHLRALSVLSGAHFIRSKAVRKPFKRRAAALDASADIPDPSVLQGIHTLLLAGRTGAAATVPARAGQLPEPLIAWETDAGQRVRLANLLGPASSLSLAVFSESRLKDAYLLGHFTAIMGCPSLILSERQDADWTQPFLDGYAKTSALASLEAVRASRRIDALLLGDRGMTPEEAAAFAADHFARYVQTGRDAYAAGDPGRALTMFENAVEIAGEVEAFAQYIGPLYEFSREAAFRAGDFEKSLHYAHLLAELAENMQPDSEMHAEALLRLGLIQANMEAYDAAVPVLERAVEMMTALDLGPKIAEAMEELGVVLENATEYDRALARFEEAAALSRGLDKGELLAAQYTNIGRLYDLRLSQYALALQNYEKALELYRSMDNAAKTVRSLVNIGRCRRLLGNFAEADRRYEEAAEILGKSGDSPGPRAEILIEKANNAWFQGRYQDAFTLQRQAFALAREHDLPLMQIIAMNTAGLIWWTLGDSEKALHELEGALEQARAFQKRRDEVATTLNNMGLIHRDAGRFDAAMDHFSRALAIDEKLQSRWAIAYDLRNQALTLMRMDRAEDALPLFQRAAEIAESIGDQVNLAKALLGLGEARAALGQREASRQAYEKVLDLSKAMYLRETWWRSLFGLAGCALPENRDEARDLLYRAVDVIEKMRADIKIEQLRDSFIQNKMAVYEMLVKLLADEGKTIEAFEAAERSRSRNFIDLLGNQRLKLPRDADQELYDRQTALRARIAAYEAVSAQSQIPEEREMAEKTLEELRFELDSTMLDIQAKNPRLASLVTVMPLRAADVMKRVEPEVALLSYYLLPEEVLCWIIRPDGIRLVRVPADRRRLGEELLEYRRMTQNLEPLDAYSRKFHQLLLAPVLPAVGAATTLGIIPHGPLHYLSFATLSDESGYLVDKYSLFYLPGASVLEVTLSRRQEEKNLEVLAIGNPDLRDPAFELPIAEYEVGTIQWNFPNITLLTRERATEAWVVENIHRFGIVHLATHGEFDPINPLFSAVKLTRGREQDGNLEAEEVFGLQINADLVVLSACQTGLGKVTAGDDVIGLTRSFLYAGTHAIVSSLWRVSDVSTAILIKHFYRSYVSLNKADSLRRAMLHVKNRYPHPGYWGAFTLVGDYR